MEFLFTTNLNAHEKDIVYEVYFDQEKYIFLPEQNDGNLEPFSFKREHDEWHDQDIISPQLRKQALNALDNYLMAQH
jgi:hypothetical protein